MTDLQNDSSQELQRLTATLDGVERAMERIDQGTYGRCEECTNELAATVLEVDPTTMHCSQCALARNDG